MRAEHAAVHVGLVDDDVAQVREQLPPGVVVGQDPDVEHVGVGDHQVGLAADRGPLLAGGVAVVDRGPDDAVQAEPLERARLVLGQRLGRVQEQRPRRRIAAQRLERRDLKAERLARGGAGGDDRRSVQRCLDRLGLVGVELVDPRRVERVWRRSGSAARGSARSGRRRRSPACRARAGHRCVPGPAAAPRVRSRSWST